MADAAAAPAAATPDSEAVIPDAAIAPEAAASGPEADASAPGPAPDEQGAKPAYEAANYVPAYVKEIEERRMSVADILERQKQEKLARKINAVWVHAAWQHTHMLVPVSADACMRPGRKPDAPHMHDNKFICICCLLQLVLCYNKVGRQALRPHERMHACRCIRPIMPRL